MQTAIANYGSGVWFFGNGCYEFYQVRWTAAMAPPGTACPLIVHLPGRNLTSLDFSSIAAFTSAGGAPLAPAASLPTGMIDLWITSGNVRVSVFFKGGVLDTVEVIVYPGSAPNIVTVFGKMTGFPVKKSQLISTFGPPVWMQLSG